MTTTKFTVSGSTRGNRRSWDTTSSHLSRELSHTFNYVANGNNVLFRQHQQIGALSSLFEEQVESDWVLVSCTRLI